MIDDFKPSIKERTTEELLKIVGASKKWNPKAVELAKKELAIRKVDTKKIKTAKYLADKKEKTNTQNKAKEGYHIIDFIFDPLPNLIEILFSWELKKDGFLRKSKQQKYFLFQF